MTTDLSTARNNAFKGNINVKFNDGKTNSYRGDVTEIQNWGDEQNLLSALKTAFPTAQIKMYSSK